MGFLLAVQLLFLALALVPGLQPLVVLANLIFAALFVSLDYTGYVLDRRGIRFQPAPPLDLAESRGHVRLWQPPPSAPFLIPGLNFLCLPWLVTRGHAAGAWRQVHPSGLQQPGPEERLDLAEPRLGREDPDVGSGWCFGL